MKLTRNCLVLLLVFVCGALCQEPSRRRRIPLRTRQRGGDEVTKAVEEITKVEEEEQEVGVVRRRQRVRAGVGRRQMAARGLPGGVARGRLAGGAGESRGRLAGAGTRGRVGSRGQGRQRAGAGGSRRFLGRRRPNPPAYYYYDDFYYDDQYEEYYQEEDYYEEYEEPKTSKKVALVNPEKEKAVKRPFASHPFSSVDLPSSALPDIGSEDYSGLITELWRQFLREKEATGQTGGLLEKAPAKEYECPPQSDVSYYEPDEEQCDKYFECNIKGEIRDHYCPDGLVFDPTLEKCDYPSKVNCTTRPKLQEPQSSTNCTRANGFFAWPANISCQNFWDCRQGTAYKQTCPVGVIFDPGLNTCATPDQSSRKECTQGKSSFLGFQCPNYFPDSVLRFGNHDRLPHPDHCQQYFTCLRTGGPRLATCARKKVFNPESGQCGDPKEVPGCENYWIDKLKDEEDSEYYYDY